MNEIIGMTICFIIGFACRYFTLPIPAPPTFMGAVLVLTMTLGYLFGSSL